MRTLVSTSELFYYRSCERTVFVRVVCSVSVVSTLEKRVMDFETQHSALQSKATEMETHYKSTLSELVEAKSQLQNQSQKEEINQQQKRHIDKLEEAS